MSDNDRVTIETGPAKLHTAVAEATKALTNVEGLYQRGGKLAQVVCTKEAEAKRDGIALGTLIIRDLPLSRFRVALSVVVIFQRYDVRAAKSVNRSAPREVLEAIYDAAEWDTVRPITGVLEAPCMRPDGSLIQAPGYDASTGYLYRPNCDFPEVPDKPTQGDANAALLEVCDLFADFPFHKAAEIYVPVAAILTVLARPAICGAVPAFVFDASTKGSGKSLLEQVIATMCTGRAAHLQTWSSRDEENSKMLQSYAMLRVPIVAIDNVASVFGGAMLDMLLTTAGPVRLRRLGETKIESTRWIAVVVAGGNNVALGTDTVRRVVIARIEPPTERPQDRTDFRHPRLLDHVAGARPRLVCAALTVLRGYVAAGRPDMGLPQWGSFEAWRDLVAQAIVWAGGDDVLGCRADRDGERDPEAEALRVVLEHLPRIAESGCTARMLSEVLWPGGRQRGEDRPPDSFDKLRDALVDVIPCRPGAVPTARQIGCRLRGWRGRVVGGKRLERKRGDSGIYEWTSSGTGI